MKLINLFQFYIFLNNVTLLNTECLKTDYFGSSKTLQKGTCLDCNPEFWNSLDKNNIHNTWNVQNCLTYPLLQRNV